MLSSCRSRSASIYYYYLLPADPLHTRVCGAHGSHSRRPHVVFHPCLPVWRQCCRPTGPSTPLEPSAPAWGGNGCWGESPHYPSSIEARLASVETPGSYPRPPSCPGGPKVLFLPQVLQEQGAKLSAPMSMAPSRKLPVRELVISPPATIPACHFAPFLSSPAVVPVSLPTESLSCLSLGGLRVAVTRPRPMLTA